MLLRQCHEYFLFSSPRVMSFLAFNEANACFKSRQRIILRFTFLSQKPACFNSFEDLGTILDLNVVSISLVHNCVDATFPSFCFYRSYWMI